MNGGAPAEDRWRIPNSVDSPVLSEEVATLRARCGLLEAPWESLLLVEGEEAASFLHGLVTQEILAMAAGATVPAALADRKGHWRADLWVHRAPARFFLRVRTERLAALTGTLERHHFAERVAWRVVPVEQPFLLLGPAVAEAWARLFETEDPVAESGASSGDDAAGGPLPPPFQGFWMKIVEIGPCDRVVFPAVGSGRALTDRWRAATDACWRIGEPAFHLLRIEAGTPWFGLDGDEERLVPEVVPDDRVSDRKGCYLGQETIARVRWRGQLRRRLDRVLFEGDEPVAPGTPVRDAAEAIVGQVLSSAPRPDGTRLAFMLRELSRPRPAEEEPAAAPSFELVTEDGRRCRYWGPDPSGNPPPA